MSNDNPVQAAAGRLAAAQRRDRKTSKAELARLRAALAVARAEREITDVLRLKATPEDRQRLADLLTH